MTFEQIVYNSSLNLSINDSDKFSMLAAAAAPAVYYNLTVAAYGINLISSNTTLPGIIHAGAVLRIKNISTINAVTVFGTVDGTTNYSLPPMAAITLLADSGVWYII